ncbi:MAG: hypothetical protein IJC73_05055 [Lentisphaeria bacterium]|nr:hypothetical protein [Lentisphaeria bacterium]
MADHSAPADFRYFIAAEYTPSPETLQGRILLCRLTNPRDGDILYTKLIQSVKYFNGEIFL